MLISVIVPVYKVEKYIHRCIDSILAQTFTDFELILVDDGSPDNCGKICDEYALKDNRIQIIHKENGGLSDARNVGIEWALEHSSSEWLTFIDSDDWVHPKYLEVLYNAAQQTNCSLSICRFERTDGINPVVDEIYVSHEVINSEDFYCYDCVNAMVAWGKLYYKEDFRMIRYPVGKIHEDEFTTYKILFRYAQVVFVDEPLYFYYENTDGIMNSSWSPKRLDALEALEQQLNFLRNKYKKAYKYRLSVFFDFIPLLNLYIDKSDLSLEQKNICKDVVLASVKRTVKRHKPRPVRNYLYYYEITYPIMTLPRKFKRKLYKSIGK